MTKRPLHAVLLDDAVADVDQLAGPLAKALDGTGPAILPLDATLERLCAAGDPCKW